MLPNKAEVWKRILGTTQVQRIGAEDKAAGRVLKSLEAARKECIAVLADVSASDRAKARAKDTANQCQAIIKQAQKRGGEDFGNEMLAAGKQGLKATWKGIGVWEPKLAGQLSSFNLLPVQAMQLFDRVVLPKWTSITGDAADAVAFAIETGLARGEAYAKLVKRVLGEHGTGSLYTTQYAAANRLVRQSVNEAFALSAKEGIAAANKYNPEIKEMWIARLVRSTPICAGLHGQVVEVGKSFKWGDWEGTAPPAIGVGADPRWHICHSITVAWHPDWDIDVRPLTPEQLKVAVDKKGMGLDLDGQPLARPETTPFGDRMRTAIAEAKRSEQEIIGIGRQVVDEIKTRLADKGMSLDEPYRPSVPKTIKDVLSEIRPLGNIEQDFTASSDEDVKDAIGWVSQYLPTDWLQASRRWGKIQGLIVDRGYYRPAALGNKATIGLSPSRSMTRVAIHEMGHRFEDVVPGIVQVEKEFYDRRTKGEALRWLGGHYKHNEKARFDKFAEPYMGKDYGGDAYELLSMGLESVFMRSIDLSLDPEFRELILGMMAAL